MVVACIGVGVRVSVGFDMPYDTMHAVPSLLCVQFTSAETCLKVLFVVKF